MKKLKQTFLLSAAAICILTACGTGTSNNETGDSSRTKSEEAIHTLNVWAWDPSFNIYAIKEAESIYQRENPEFSLNVMEISWEDMQTRLGTILSSGEYSQLPDIILMQDFAYQKYVMTYEDLFLDLTNSGIDFSEFSFSKTANSVVDERNYGIPFDNGAEIAAYRIDILEECGYTIDNLTDIDWDQFIEIGKDILDKTGYSLLSSQSGSSDIIIQMVQSAGGSIWQEDGSPNIIDNEILLKALEIYKELFHTGVMTTSNGWDEYIATFTSGRTCGVVNGCWIMASIESADELSGLWRITNMPSLPGIAGATNYSNQGGSSWGITSNCKNPDLAIDFMKQTFAGSKEFYDKILLGAGALSTWIPAGESEVYSEAREFYGYQTVFEMITDFAAKTPEFDVGIYFTEANDALAVAATNISTGGDIQSELEYAEETIKFSMP